MRETFAIAVLAIASPAIADPVSDIYYVPMKPEPPPPPPAEPMSRTPAYVAAGVTAALAIGTGAFWLEHSGGGGSLEGAVMVGIPAQSAIDQRTREIHRYYLELGGLSAATIGSILVTSVLWSKSSKPATRIGVAPAPRGVAVTLDGHF
jgi:hypothetical protein